MKKKIVLVLVISLCLCVITGCGCNKKKKTESKKKVVDPESTIYDLNTNKGIVEDKELKGLKFTKTSLKTSEYYSTLLTKVENTTDKDIYVKIFNIYFKDKDGKLVLKAHGYVGGVVPAHDSRNISTSVDMDLKNAYNVEYEMVEG